MPSLDLFSIGHSNIPAERFVGMLRDAGVNAVADVRSIPFSRFCPWFSRKNLEPRLVREGISYLPAGDALGGRPRDPSLFRDGAADYEAMARQPQFQVALHRVMQEAARFRVCLICAEREPLDCHRCLLVARALAERGLRVSHILHDGSVEPHAATERRLLALSEECGDLFVTGQNERLAAAYRSRARAVAFRVRPRSTGARA